MTATSQHGALKQALAGAAETIHAKGEVQPMIIAHTANALMAFPLAGMIDSSTTKDVTAEMIGAEMRKSVTPGFMSSCPRQRWQRMVGKTRRHLSGRIEVLVLSASDDEGDSVATYRTVRNARGRSHH